MKLEKKFWKKYAAIGASLVVALGLLYFVVVGFTGQSVATEGQRGNEGNYDSFAKCLAEKGVVMYGTKTCPHCASQKGLFGDSFQFVDYVECTEQEQLCQQKGVNAVPTWEIDGTFYTGERSLESLAELSGCPLK
jgi:glutaredoxin